MNNFDSFGYVTKGTDYHIRSSLHKQGVPLNICEAAIIENGRITIDGKLIYKYKFYKNSYEPVFKKMDLNPVSLFRRFLNFFTICYN